jgi:hypothetical protein
MMRLRPCTVKAAQAFVRVHHRHLPTIQGGLFAVTVEDGKEIVGVGIAGHPARVWMGTGRIVISRVATTGAPNACSMIYGALCRAAKALAYSEVWTYTLPEEPGSSLRAAGFEDMGMTEARETYSRPSRSRRPSVRPEAKRRWRRLLCSARLEVRHR